MEKSLTVRNISSCLTTLTDWYALGHNLGIPTHKLDMIRINRRDEVSHCKFSLFDLWLRTDLQASWTKLVDALNEMEEKKMVSIIQERYLGIKPDSAARGAGISAADPVRAPAVVNRAGGSIQQEISDAEQLIKARPSEGTKKLESLMTGLTHWNFDVNYALEPMKQTLLHSATMANDTSCVKGLLAFGANVNSKNAFGQTPLDMAIIQQSREIATLLESVGGKSGLPQQQAPLISLQSLGAQKYPGHPRVLCIDSSDRMAVLQLEVLRQIEQRAEKKISELFDWIVASGITALLLMAMLYAEKSCADVRRLYFQLHEKVLTLSTAAQKSEALHKLIHELFDDQLQMCDLQKPNLMIAAVCKKTTRLTVDYFSNCFHDELRQIPVWKAACYTTASPLHFTEFDGYVDAGVICGSLCDSALFRIHEFCGGNPYQFGCVVSIGAGIFQEEELGSINAQEFLTFGPHWVNPEEAVQKIVNVIKLFNSASSLSSEESTKNCDFKCKAEGVPFYRFNPIFQEKLPLLERVGTKALVDYVIQTIIQTLGRNFEMMMEYLNARGAQRPHAQQPPIPPQPENSADFVGLAYRP